MNRQELKEYLIRCCYWYYVKADPLVKDKAYDYMVYELKTLENKEGIWDSDSPTQMIWGDCEDQYPEWAKVRE